MKSSESDFHAECEELLDESSRLLLDIQDQFPQSVDPDSINALFRSVHTLKGLAGLFGHDDISEISHSLESLLDDIRLGRVELTDRAIDFFLKYTDTLGQLVSTPKDEREGEAQGYLDEIDRFRESLQRGEEEAGPEGLISKSILEVLSEYEEHRLKANIKDGKGIYLVKPSFPFEDFDKKLTGLIAEIKVVGELISTMPTSEDVPEGSIGFNLMFGSPKTAEGLSEDLKRDVKTLVPPEDEELLEPSVLRETETDKDSEGAVADTGVATAKTSTSMVRVDISKLDRILNTISELSLSRSAVKRIWEEMTEEFGHSPLVLDIYKLNQSLEHRIEELQGQVLEIRMVPIGQIYGRLSQVIRRYSREVGKKIDLKMFGEDTEIDKYLAEETVDPLVHIVRNAIDHGLEVPDERRAAGKEETGEVTLRAFQRGNHVVIEVSDDGKGIDVGKIRRRAIERGMIDEETEVTERDLFEFMFTPGFSTKDVVSEVSGRGVGLDIAKEKISSLGGFVDVRTDIGKGTTFMLTLPITLAILKVLMIRVGDGTFALPLTSISETLTIERSKLQTIENRLVFNLRGELLPVASIKEIFKVKGDEESDSCFAVIVGFGERRIGLLVDELLGQSEVVIKPLGGYFEGVKGLAGAAELGRHDVVLVLDVEGVIDECTSPKGAFNV